MSAPDPYAEHVAAYCARCAEPTEHVVSRHLDGDEAVCEQCGEAVFGQERIADLVSRAAGDYRYFVP